MRALALLFLLPIAGSLASPALAQAAASAGELRSAIVGNSVEGAMAASGPYAEFYAPDGTILAADYAGRWSIKGNKMCFDYGDGPAGCWQAVISGKSVIWIGATGEEGSGRIRPGNPAGW